MTQVVRGWDADLGDALAAGELGEPPADLAAFEAAFVRHVQAGACCPEAAWDAFYDSTLDRVAHGWGAAEGGGTVDTFSRIWARAARLSRGASVLDVGSCFGFLALVWSARPGAPHLLSADLSHPSAALLARQARRLGRAVTSVCADGTRLPMADRAVDTVLVLHVLEHLRPPPAGRLLAEALRVARQRVVVAVPIEDVPDRVYGHLQAFDLPALGRLGRLTGWQATVEEADGGWLVLDRPDPFR